MSFDLPIPQAPETLSVLIPEMSHPLIVHFAVALPLVIVLFEFLNLASRRRSIALLSLFFMIVLSAVFYAALLSGDMDAAKAHSILGSEAKNLIGSHRSMGIYLFYGSIVMVLVKLVSLLSQKTVLKLFVLTVALGLAVVTVTAGSDGEKLVYTHGVNVLSAGGSSAPRPSGVSEKTEKNTEPVSETERKDQNISGDTDGDSAEVQEAKEDAAKSPEPSGEINAS